jgi:cytoskeleton protein RodZ
MAEDNRQPAPATSAPEKRSVGEILKEARNAQSLTLEQVATELRIELPQLEALEGDRFERIGVPVFVKGYLRQYAARLGIDPRDLLVQYYKQTSLKEVQVQPSKTIKLRDERQITVWVIAALAILVVIAGLAAWWVGAGGSPVARGPSAAPKTSGDEKAASAAPAATPEPASAPASGAAAGGAAAPPAEPAPSPSAPVATPAPSGAAAPAATPTPSGAAAPATTPTPSGGAANATTTLAVATPPPGARSAERPAPTSSPPAAASSATATSPPAAASAAQPNSDDGAGASLVVPLDFTFEQESWAEVTDARGERLYYGLGTAGKHAAMRGEPPFAVVLGNAGGVKIVVDGEDFAIPAKGKPGEYARFSVNVVSD